MYIGRLLLMLLIITGCGMYKAACQSSFPQAFKTLNVANGLPQSFISGLVQDNTGFVWIGTRDGLARYDGRKFKIFRHVPGDSTTLKNNTIINLFLDRQSKLWIVYETGDIDILNTQTEQLFHFTTDPLYRQVYGIAKLGNTINEDNQGNIWILTNNNGAFICNLDKQTLQFCSYVSIGLHNTKVVSISSSNGNIILVTDTAIVEVNSNRKIVQTILYNFSNPHIYDAEMDWKDVHLLFRQDGEIILHDEDRLIIYQPVTKSFAVIQLPEKSLYSNSMVQDSRGQVYFDNNEDIFTLTVHNELKLWKPKKENPQWGFKSMLFDKSGVLWLGSNGAGIQLFDLRLPRLSAISYKLSFPGDMLKDLLHISDEMIQSSFLNHMQAYRFRWTTDHAGKIWFTKADVAAVIQPPVCYYKDGRLVQPQWHYTDTVSKNHVHINAFAFSQSGKFWGIDFYMRPVYFDTATKAVTVYPAIANVNFDYTFTANSLLIEGEDKFWITTSLNGLYFYNRKTGQTINYAYSEAKGALPTNQLMNLVQDVFNPDILWIGSLGGGLIKFSKSTGKCVFYTERNGLPNSTVYAVVADKQGILWCSSNKGIFSFNPKTNAVLQSFTSKDGLPGDEFNRYHFLQLPDGRMAFGGVDGYTVFDPLNIASDNYQPQIALTGITINNTAADFGHPASPFKQTINSLKEIELPYNQNFLTFEFSALQYNITEKLQYRYKLDGFDDNWVNAGNNNIAAYTKLPPGHYVFKVNATNTAGKWSRHIKTLPVIIQPPFWQTWWFITIVLLAAAALIYFAIKKRIASVRQEEQQKARFEREASELKAQALRAQMNPHFIFNCLNSIKALIHEDNKRQAISYLTTFSKLIRSQLNNAQHEVSLHDELQTCRLYAELEALRFGSNIVCEFNIDERVDIFSFDVPPLIIQPFIENAIWHGILPKEGGKVCVSVTQPYDDVVQCAIEDNGIGREISMLNKSQQSATYESKGMQLVKNRLNLFNIIHNCGGSIEVIDKKDNQQHPAGTLVIIKFKKSI